MRCGLRGQLRLLLTVLIAAAASSAIAQDVVPDDRPPLSGGSGPAASSDALVAAPVTTDEAFPAPSASAPPENEEEPAPAAAVPSNTGEPCSVATPTAGVPPEQVPMPASPPADDGPGSTIVDQFREGVSTGLLNTAVWLDSFFGDERYEAEANDSHFKVSAAPFFEDGSWSTVRPDYELRLVLPQMRQKTRLVISGDMWNEGEGVPDTASGPLAPAKPPQERDVATSLQVILPSHNRHSTSLRTGVRYHAGDFIYYAGPRYRYLLPLDRWTARFTENMLWEAKQGWESRSRIDLERPLPRYLFFRASTEGIWTEGVKGYLYSLSFLLRQPLDHKRAVQYEWDNLFQTRPVDVLTEVRLVFRYRQQIWRPWLFLEIAPQYRFPRDRSFEATPGILFRLEMVFSKQRGSAPVLP